jgi:hypothetical protein
MFPCRSSRARRLYRQCALAAVGIQQFPELSSFEGVDVVGPLPSELQEHIEYAVAIPVNAVHPETGKPWPHSFARLEVPRHLRRRDSIRDRHVMLSRRYLLALTSAVAAIAAARSSSEGDTYARACARVMGS